MPTWARFCVGLQGLRSSQTPKLYPSSGYGFGVWSDERRAAEHKNMHCVLVVGRGWAKEAPNTQNVPYGCVSCVRVKENGPTAKMHPYGRVFAIGMKGEGRESVSGLPNMKMCPQGHDFVLDCTRTQGTCPSGHVLVFRCRDGVGRSPNMKTVPTWAQCRVGVHPST